MSNRTVAVAFVALMLTPSFAAADSYLVKALDRTGVQVVQQHTTYIEFITEETGSEGGGNGLVEEFGAIVGLLKHCRTVKRTFDNAVKWFNDQFLFGDKWSKVGPPSIGNDTLGIDRPDKTRRFIDCSVPNGFIVMTAAGVVRSREQLEKTWELDRDCNEKNLPNCNHVVYQASYFVTDPNGVRWVMDRYRVRTFIMNVAGDLTDGPPIPFHSTDMNAMTTVFIVHLQVAPDRQPHRDEAPWRWRDTGIVRDGTPRFEAFDDEKNETIDPAHECRTNLTCNIEYDFLLLVDFRQISSSAPRQTHVNTTTTESKAGNSHPHNPTSGTEWNGTCPSDNMANKSLYPHRCARDVGGPPDNGTDPHQHNTRRVDLFFTRRGPWHLEQTRYWDSLGAPPAPGPDCRATPELALRTWVVCDTVRDTGFHLHDGTQTP